MPILLFPPSFFLPASSSGLLFQSSFRLSHFTLCLGPAFSGTKWNQAGTRPGTRPSSDIYYKLLYVCALYVGSAFSGTRWNQARNQAALRYFIHIVVCCCIWCSVRVFGNQVEPGQEPGRLAIFHTNCCMFSQFVLGPRFREPRGTRWNQARNQAKR